MCGERGGAVLVGRAEVSNSMVVGLLFFVQRVRATKGRIPAIDPAGSTFSIDWWIHAGTHGYGLRSTTAAAKTCGECSESVD